MYSSSYLRELKNLIEHRINIFSLPVSQNAKEDIVNGIYQVEVGRSLLNRKRWGEVRSEDFLSENGELTLRDDYAEIGTIYITWGINFKLDFVPNAYHPHWNKES